MSGADEDRRRAARAEQVALFRYQLIREAADPELTVRQRGRLVREIAGKAHPGPFGEPVTVSRATMRRCPRQSRPQNCPPGCLPGMGRPQLNERDESASSAGSRGQRHERMHRHA